MKEIYHLRLTDKALTLLTDYMGLHLELTMAEMESLMKINKKFHIFYITKL